MDNLSLFDLKSLTAGEASRKSAVPYYKEGGEGGSSGGVGGGGGSFDFFTPSCQNTGDLLSLSLSAALYAKKVLLGPLRTSLDGSG